MALLEVGRIVRPHGLRGEVVVSLVTNRPDRLDAGSLLTASVPGEAARTLEVLTARPHQGRYLVCFAGIDDHDAAEALRGLVLSAEAVEDPDVLFVHDLIGAELVDQLGVSHGPVRSIEANPASDLLVVDDGYVPVRFVTGLAEGKVTVEVPEGLFG
ncbi:MAG TPA: ribosome maturation factor RimM [Acidimicrobiales bacterium]|nr:ribosome maturation factor RimM [Acidimicrobiales bacterium]